MTSSETLTWSEKETEEFGATLASRLSREDVVYLVGDLGTGKTSLARGVARGLGASAREVASPTFAIVNEYADPKGTIVLRHLDLYRLADDPRELEVLGLPESVAGAPVCVEWPRRRLYTLLPPTLVVTLEARPDDSRRIRIDRRDP